MAPAKRNLNPTGLGRAIINRKVQDTRQMHQSGMYTTDVDSAARLKSVTQERDLDAFLNNAQLAGTEFTAERRNLKIIQTSGNPKHNPYLLSDQEEKDTLQKHQENKQRLRVPRRPPWVKGMPISQLERQEKDAFLDWRRGLAELQEQEKFLLTPFERNLEVWRQLWRVLERSHLVVQIVDARNPLRFRCEDLESYVLDVEGPEGEKGTGKGIRKNLLLINKADLLTPTQRRLWADFFDGQGIDYAFFSAANAAAIQQTRRDAAMAQAALLQSKDAESGNVLHDLPQSDTRGDAAQDTNDTYEDESGSAESDGDGSEQDSSEDGQQEGQRDLSLEEDATDLQNVRTKVLSVIELEQLFEKLAPDIATFATASGPAPQKLVVGLVGYPNVGKSSTINALLGEKKVSVSSTPGKTKHFQTIHLSNSIILCDCPGLVFPQFATTKADLVCDGVLPIDQMKEYTGPIALVVRRIPKDVLEALYGLSVKVNTLEEGGEGSITAENLLISYAIARGFTRSGQGNPDEARAARYILKDYVNAKLLFCHPPPGSSETNFNQRTHELALQRAHGKKHAPVTRVKKDADTFVGAPDTGAGVSGQPGVGPKSRAVDRDFFANGSTLSARPFIQGSGHDGHEFTRAKLYPHQNSVADDGTPLSLRQARVGAVMQNGVAAAPGKKSHKKSKRVKQRSGKGYD